MLNRFNWLLEHISTAVGSAYSRAIVYVELIDHGANELEDQSAQASLVIV